MKKIVFLLSLAICGINFSAACKWISDKPTYYEKKMIELIKKKKLENRVYCDSDNDRMVYQTVNKNEYWAWASPFSAAPRRSATLPAVQAAAAKTNSTIATVKPNLNHNLMSSSCV